MIVWIIGGRVHRKSSAKKVTHVSAIPIFRPYAAESRTFHGNQIKALDFSQGKYNAG